MKEHTSVQERNEKAHIAWDSRIALVLPGCIMLGGGITSLLRVAWSFVDNAHYQSFISNWIPWIAVLFFVSGWLLAHGVEIALFEWQIKVVRALGISFLLAVVIIIWGLPKLIESPVFQDMDGFAFLLASGYFFRYSTFHRRTSWLLPNALFGEKQKNQ